MSKELFVSSTPHETKVAIVEDDQLTEVYYERENEYTLAGSIYKGRVTRVLPGMQSAFVNIGLERDAFLYVSDFLLEEEDDDTEAIEQVVARSRHDVHVVSEPRQEFHQRPLEADEIMPGQKVLKPLNFQMQIRQMLPPKLKAAPNPETAKARADGAAAAVADGDVTASSKTAQTVVAIVVRSGVQSAAPSLPEKVLSMRPSSKYTFLRNSAQSLRNMRQSMETALNALSVALIAVNADLIAVIVASSVVTADTIADGNVSTNVRSTTAVLRKVFTKARRRSPVMNPLFCPENPFPSISPPERRRKSPKL